MGHEYDAVWGHHTILQYAACASKWSDCSADEAAIRWASRELNSRIATVYW